MNFCKEHGVPDVDFDIEYFIYEDLTDESWDMICNSGPPDKFEDLRWRS